jgi:hypothetical protein
MKCRLLRRRRAHLRVPSPGAAAIAAQRPGTSSLRPVFRRPTGAPQTTARPKDQPVAGLKNEPLALFIERPGT